MNEGFHRDKDHYNYVQKNLPDEYIVFNRQFSFYSLCIEFGIYLDDLLCDRGVFRRGKWYFHRSAKFLSITHLSCRISLSLTPYANPNP